MADGDVADVADVVGVGGARRWSRGRRGAEDMALGGGGAGGGGGGGGGARVWARPEAWAPYANEPYANAGARGGRRGSALIGCGDWGGGA